MGGVHLQKCMAKCKVDGAMGCTRVVWTHHFGLDRINKDAITCPFSTTQVADWRLLSISYAGDESLSYIEEALTKGEQKYGKEIHKADTVKAGLQAPKGIVCVACNVKAINMLKVSESVCEGEGDINVQYVLECPKCHKRYKYTEGFTLTTNKVEVAE